MISVQVVRNEIIEARDLLDPKRFGPLFVNWSMRNSMIRAIPEHATVCFVSAAPCEISGECRSIWEKKGARGKYQCFKHCSNQCLSVDQLVSFPLPRRARNLLLRVEIASTNGFYQRYHELEKFVETMILRCMDPEKVAEVYNKLSSRMFCEEKTIIPPQLSARLKRTFVYSWVIHGINPKLKITVEFYRTTPSRKQAFDHWPWVDPLPSWGTRDFWPGGNTDVLRHAANSAISRIEIRAFSSEDRLGASPLFRTRRPEPLTFGAHALPCT